MKRFFFLLCALALLWGVGMFLPAEPPLPAPEAAPAPEREPGPVTVTLVAAGDNLIHDVLYEQAKTGSGYDFCPLYRHIRPLIEEADLALINQETPMAGSFPPSGYPRFNSPVELAQGLAQSGFDVLSLANNHMLDMGPEGLGETIGLVRETPGLSVTGAFLPGEEAAPLLLEKNGITFAILGFTSYTNLGGGADSGGGMVPLLRDDERLRALMARARKRADVVVVYTHWGQEDSFAVTTSQRDSARLLAREGADIILGSHPHVVQSAEALAAPDGRQAWVLYSLGNLVSAQRKGQNLVGLLPRFTIRKGADGRVEIDPPALTPVVTYYGPHFRDLAVYPLKQYTPDLAAGHGVRAFGEELSPETVRAILRENGITQ
ncbi:CapA family protein [Harryflintia acetispora]|uniref:CapA family protein n=1 Tax=Harryflintia acetispora TaxID=1849041 RepID=UPI001896E236|nr:CapA family protein [Harryflintia acetispora]